MHKHFAVKLFTLLHYFYILSVFNRYFHHQNKQICPSFYKYISTHLKINHLCKYSRMVKVKSRAAVKKSHAAVEESHVAVKKSRMAVEESHAADEKKYRSLCVLLEVYKTGPKIPYSDYALYLFIGIVSVLCQLYFCKSNFLLYMIKLLVYDWNFYFNVFSSYFVSYRSLLCCITKSFLAWCPEC